MHSYKWRQRTMISKNKILRLIHSYILVAIGTFVLAFGSVIFLAKCELVSGGVSGIAIIIQHFVNINIFEYAVAGLMVIMWLIGLVFVGKSFAIRTLFSTALFIGFTFLFNRIEFFNRLAVTFAGMEDGNTPQVGNYILCGVFGGVFVGGGVAITFIGGGSTGGVDVLMIILSKYARIKESVGSFIVDASIIVAGMIAMQMWIPALCGLLSCVVAAALVEIVYIKHQSSYQVDIISEKWQEINEYSQKVLDRGTTIIRAEGGYKGDERIILRIVFDRMQYEKIREYIASVDPHAFVTFTQTNAVYGEGFNSNRKLKKKDNKNEK